MGNLQVEEKGVGDGGCLLDNLHVLFGEESIINESHHHRSFSADWVEDDDDIRTTHESHHPTQRDQYWESQHALLQEILERYRLTGSKLREEVIRRVIGLARERDLCHCPKPTSNTTCASCLRRSVVELLSRQGFNASLRTSKWNNTHKFPGGTHEYIEMTVSTQGKKKQIPLVIELEFRGEFEMAKACNDYSKLINELPETYIGKPDCLNAMVCIVCDAAKRSRKDQNMHMAPWRKTSFMQMKWSASTSYVNKLSMDTSCFHITSTGTALVVT